MKAFYTQDQLTQLDKRCCLRTEVVNPSQISLYGKSQLQDSPGGFRAPGAGSIIFSSLVSPNFDKYYFSQSLTICSILLLCLLWGLNYPYAEFPFPIFYIHNFLSKYSTFFSFHFIIFISGLNILYCIFHKIYFPLSSCNINFIFIMLFFLLISFQSLPAHISPPLDFFTPLSGVLVFLIDPHHSFRRTRCQCPQHQNTTALSGTPAPFCSRQLKGTLTKLVVFVPKPIQTNCTLLCNCKISLNITYRRKWSFVSIKNYIECFRKTQ